jgi:hypothetical protein
MEQPAKGRNTENLADVASDTSNWIARAGQANSALVDQGCQLK